MNKKMEPTCPFCNTDCVELDDVIKEYFNDNKYVKFCVGHCNKCHEFLEWNVIYKVKFDKIEIL